MKLRQSMGQTFYNDVNPYLSLEHERYYLLRPRREIDRQYSGNSRTYFWTMVYPLLMQRSSAKAACGINFSPVPWSSIASLTRYLHHGSSLQRPWSIPAPSDQSHHSRFDVLNGWSKATYPSDTSLYLRAILASEKHSRYSIYALQSPDEVYGSISQLRSGMFSTFLTKMKQRKPFYLD